MKFEGPDPVEALGISEELLTPDESARIIDYMTEFDAIAHECLPGRITEDDVSPEQWQAIQSAVRKLRGDVFDSHKDSVIEHRD